MRENTFGAALDNQDLESQINTLIITALARINTIKLCKIVSIDEDKYKVQNLISRVNANGSEIIPDIYYDVYDLQASGSNGGFVFNRAVGDIVAVGFFDRESSVSLASARQSVSKSYGIAPPSSAVILGAVYYSSPAVNITINNKITMNGDTTLNGNLTVNGKVTVSDDVIANGISQTGHTHDVPGAGLTAPNGPVTGSAISEIPQ